MGVALIHECDSYAKRVVAGDRESIQALLALARAASSQEVAECLHDHAELLARAVEQTPPDLARELESAMLALDGLRSIARRDSYALPVRTRIVSSWIREYGTRAALACERALASLRDWAPIDTPFIPSLSLSQMQPGRSNRVSRVYVLPDSAHVPLKRKYILLETNESLRKMSNPNPHTSPMRSLRTGLNQSRERMVRLISVVWELLYKYNEFAPGMVQAGLVRSVAADRSAESACVADDLGSRLRGEAGPLMNIIRCTTEDELTSEGQFEPMVVRATMHTSTLPVDELAHCGGRMGHFMDLVRSTNLMHLLGCSMLPGQPGDDDVPPDDGPRVVSLAPSLEPLLKFTQDVGRRVCSARCPQWSGQLSIPLMIDAIRLTIDSTLALRRRRCSSVNNLLGTAPLPSAVTGLALHSQTIRDHMHRMRVASTALGPMKRQYGGQVCLGAAEIRTIPKAIVDQMLWVASQSSAAGQRPLLEMKRRHRKDGVSICIHDLPAFLRLMATYCASRRASGSVPFPAPFS